MTQYRRCQHQLHQLAPRTALQMQVCVKAPENLQRPTPFRNHPAHRTWPPDDGFGPEIHTRSHTAGTVRCVLHLPLLGGTCPILRQGRRCKTTEKRYLIAGDSAG
jgi:hypothetical protein